MRKLDIQSASFKVAPHAILDEARQDGPFAVAKIPFLGLTKLALSHEAAHAVLKDTDRFALDARNAGHKRPLGLAFMPGSLRLLSENILSLDDPDHQRLRRLADAPFRRAAIESGRERIAAQVDTYLDEVGRQSKDGAEVDLVETVFRPLPLQVIANMLGLTDGARERLAKTMSAFTGVSGTIGILRALGSMGGVVKQLRVEIETARLNPQEGLLSALIHAEEEGGKMSEDELVSLVLVLFVAGHDTTTNLLSSGLYTLLHEPGALQTAKSLDEDGWRTAVDELMRFAMPVHITKPRFAKQDTDVSGVSIKKGEKVMACLGAANLDPAVFEDPLKLDLNRRPNRHTGWGGGPHICLGIHLAKMETELTLSKIVERWPDLSFGDGLKWAKRMGVRGLEKMPMRLA